MPWHGGGGSNYDNSWSCRGYGTWQEPWTARWVDEPTARWVDEPTSPSQMTRQAKDRAHNEHMNHLWTAAADADPWQQAEPSGSVRAVSEPRPKAVVKAALKQSGAVLHSGPVHIMMGPPQPRVKALPAGMGPPPPRVQEYTCPPAAPPKAGANQVDMYFPMSTTDVHARVAGNSMAEFHVKNSLNMPPPGLASGPVLLLPDSTNVGVPVANRDGCQLPRERYGTAEDRITLTLALDETAPPRLKAMPKPAVPRLWHQPMPKPPVPVCPVPHPPSSSTELQGRPKSGEGKGGAGVTVPKPRKPSPSRKRAKTPSRPVEKMDAIPENPKPPMPTRPVPSTAPTPPMPTRPVPSTPPAPIAIVTLASIQARPGSQLLNGAKFNNIALKFLRDSNEQPPGFPLVSEVDLTHSPTILIGTIDRKFGTAYSFNYDIMYPWSWVDMLQHFRPELLRTIVGDGVARMRCMPIANTNDHKRRHASLQEQRDGIRTALIYSPNAPVPIWDFVVTQCSGAEVRFHPGLKGGKVEISSIINPPTPMAPAAGLGMSDGPGTYRRMLNQAYDGSGRVSSAVTAVAVHDHDDGRCVAPPVVDTRGPSESSTARAEGSTVYVDGRVPLVMRGWDVTEIVPMVMGHPDNRDNGTEADGTEMTTTDNVDNLTATTVATGELRILDAASALWEDYGIIEGDENLTAATVATGGLRILDAPAALFLHAE